MSNTQPVNENEEIAKLALRVSGVVIGPLFVLIPGWILVVKLQIFRAPGLMRFFPGAYFLLFTCVAIGLGVTAVSIFKLIKK